MKAIIYVCHGSRVQTAREQAVTFIKKCIAQSPAPIKKYCFLELGQPTIEEAFISCVRQGATIIAVIPVLLLTAAHAKVDIPNKLAQMAALFPGIDIYYGQPIGVNPKMIAPITQRIRETGIAVTDHSLVLLVGRGSSDPDVKGDLNKIAGLLSENTTIMNVKTCFLTAVSPSLEEGMREAAEGSYDKVFVIPYLLFTGILMKRIQRVIEISAHSETFILCQNLGYNPTIESILLDQVNDLIGEGIVSSKLL